MPTTYPPIGHGTSCTRDAELSQWTLSRMVVEGVPAGVARVWRGCPLPAIDSGCTESVRSDRAGPLGSDQTRKSRELCMKLDRIVAALGGDDVTVPWLECTNIQSRAVACLLIQWKRARLLDKQAARIPTAGSMHVRTVTLTAATATFSDGPPSSAYRRTHSWQAAWTD